jgi:hypothetical protein
LLNYCVEPEERSTPIRHEPLSAAGTSPPAIGRMVYIIWLGKGSQLGASGLSPN